jgi:hypothetical protein
MYSDETSLGSAIPAHFFKKLQGDPSRLLPAKELRALQTSFPQSSGLSFVCQQRLHGSANVSNIVRIKIEHSIAADLGQR